MKPTDRHQEEFDINKAKVPRTIEGTIMEAIAAMFLIGAWVIALARHQFNGAIGEQWKTGIIGLTIAVVALLVCCYFPRYMNRSHRFTNMRQVNLSVRSFRVLAIEFALAILCNAISGCTLMTQRISPIIFIVVVLVTALIYSIFIHRAK